MPPPLKRSAMLSPAMISDEPGFGIRPSMSLTWGRKASELAPMPRIVTLASACRPPLGQSDEDHELLGKKRSGRPAPMATSGCVSTMEAWSRSTPLCTSDVEPLRMTTTLSYEPVSTRVFSQPLGQHEDGGEDEDHQRHARGGEDRGEPPRPEVAEAVGEGHCHLSDPPQAVGDADLIAPARWERWPPQRPTRMPAAISI